MYVLDESRTERKNGNSLTHPERLTQFGPLLGHVLELFLNKRETKSRTGRALKKVRFSDRFGSDLGAIGEGRIVQMCCVLRWFREGRVFCSRTVSGAIWDPERDAKQTKRGPRGGPKSGQGTDLKSEQFPDPERARTANLNLTGI